MSDYDDHKYFGGRVKIGRNREKENSSSVTGFLRLINNNSQSSPDTETMKETDGKLDETLPWIKDKKLTKPPDAAVPPTHQNAGLNFLSNSCFQL